MVLVKILSWLVMAVIGIAIVMFSVVNRGPVTVDLWPLPYVQDLRVYQVVLGALILGFLWGALATWIANGRTRSKARQRFYELDFTQRELRHAKEKLEMAEADERARRRAETEALPPANAA